MPVQSEDELLSIENDPIYALAAPASFGQPGVACFAARRTGLARSEDGGHTWLNAYESFLSGQLLATSSVVLSPDYARDHVVFTGVHGGVVRSNDGGHHWRSAIFPPPAPMVVALVVSPNFGEDGILFAGTAENGVFMSSDGGANWSAWNFGLLDLNVLCLAISPNFVEDETLFVGTTTGLFVSANGGRAWREVVMPADLTTVLSLAVSLHYRDDRTVYVGTEEHGLFHSSARKIQAGVPWEKVGQSSLTQPINAILLASDFPRPWDLLVLHGSELLYSPNQGETFEQWTRPGLEPDFEIMAVAAPAGFGPGSPVLIGRGEGEVLVV
jgi:photosystem II stability/assembly factor-like uncharacterized protein